MGIDLLSNHGIDPRAKKILVAKSNQHFYASFSTVASEVIYADGDGPIPKDIRRQSGSTPHLAARCRGSAQVDLVMRKVRYSSSATRLSRRRHA
jgi:microcystin degradation protein MlrC